MPKTRILLLTNRDSDNVGDQVIEGSVISLIKGVMHNLGFDQSEYIIESRAASIVPKAYLKTGDEKYISRARTLISRADVLVFGGAPLFNYAYQSFYLRTIKTVELAQEYGVPVLFSSIGVEPFDDTNPKSLALKEALALPCVRQVTTRDDFASLEKYMEGTGTPIGHVADPAVFADVVFGGGPPHPDGNGQTRKRIGLVATRAGLFKDNRIDFSERDQREFWKNVIRLLADRGYDYHLFTTGHFSDEVFLDALLREGAVPRKHVTVAVNSPEELIAEISECDGIIAYRLHASITAFAYSIPSVGLSWNFKVPHFYDSVGYGQRALPPGQWKADVVVSALERAMSEGVSKDADFLMSVYETLFLGLKAVLARESDLTPVDYPTLRNQLPRYEGTNEELYRRKVTAKLRRTYDNYQALSESLGRSSFRGSAGRKLVRIVELLLQPLRRMFRTT